MKTLAEEKRKAYLEYKSNRSQQEFNRYKVERNSRVNNNIQNLKKRYWEKFSSDMEHDLYGGQKKIWKMLRNRKNQLMKRNN